MAELAPHLELPRGYRSLESLEVLPVDAPADAISTQVVSDWTIGTPIRVTGQVVARVDTDQQLRQLRLDGGHLVSGLVWYATGTRRGGAITAVGNADTDVFDATITEPIDGELRLRVIVVTKAAVSTDPLAPVLDGSIVWEATERFYLSGGRARFPMLALSFKEAGLGPRGALWYVSVDLSDLGASPSSALELMLNTDHPRHDDLLAAERSDLMSMLEYDIRRHAVEAMLDADDVSALPDMEPGTLGSFLRQSLLAALGHADLSLARTRRRTDRSGFETEMRGNVLALPDSP